MGDAGGIEFTGDYIRIHAQRIADAHVEKAAKLAADAELRAVVATTEAGARGGGAGGGKGRCRGGGGRGPGGRVAWKDVTAELAAKLKDKEATNTAPPGTHTPAGGRKGRGYRPIELGAKSLDLARPSRG